MGDIKKRKRKFDTPAKRWDKGRIDSERGVKNRFGLKNKRELWKTETFLRKKKEDARKLLAMEPEQREKREKELIDSLAKYGLLDEKAGIDDVLSMTTESLLERRLETIAWRHGLASTIKQARQFIVHGHVAVKSKKVTIPSYMVKKDEEDKIGYYGTPPLVQEKKKREIRKEMTDKEKLKKEFEKAVPPEEAGKKIALLEEDAGKEEEEAEEEMEEEIKEAQAEGEPEEVEKESDDTEEDVEEKEETDEEEEGE
ncbi:MAG: 30S ribosomal protein S4 [Candidatus ainarchaeum sp.]|nr:30S ribosomal protein S4 [Candidatus ainarchaeum sp.]